MKLVDGKLAVKKDGGDVDALTAATISSRAYVDAINRAWMAYKQRSDGYGADRRIVGSDFCGRRFGRGTNQRAGGSGRRAK